MIKTIAITFITFIIILSNTNMAFAEDKNSELPECIVITHCVRENWKSSEVEQTFNKIVKAVKNSPRTKIVEENNFYIHAEAQTKWRRYTDDLLVKALPEKGYVQVRSESRVGIGDNGVNKKRINDLAYIIMTNQAGSSN